MEQEAVAAEGAAADAADVAAVVAMPAAAVMPVVALRLEAAEVAVAISAAVVPEVLPKRR